MCLNALFLLDSIWNELNDHFLPEGCATKSGWRNNRRSRVCKFLNRFQSWDLRIKHTFEAYSWRWEDSFFYYLTDFCNVCPVHVHFRKAVKLWYQTWDVWNVNNVVVQSCGWRAVRLFGMLLILFMLRKRFRIWNICLCVWLFFFLASPQWHNEARRLCSNVIGYPPGLLPESIFGMISHVRMKDFPFFCCDITIKVTMWGSVIWCSECIWMQVIKFRLIQD